MNSPTLSPDSPSTTQDSSSTFPDSSCSSTDSSSSESPLTSSFTSMSPDSPSSTEVFPEIISNLFGDIKPLSQVEHIDDNISSTENRVILDMDSAKISTENSTDFSNSEEVLVESTYTIDNRVTYSTNHSIVDNGNLHEDPINSLSYNSVDSLVSTSNIDEGIETENPMMDEDDLEEAKENLPPLHSITDTDPFADEEDTSSGFGSAVGGMVSTLDSFSRSYESIGGATGSGGAVEVGSFSGMVLDSSSLMLDDDDFGDSSDDLEWETPVARLVRRSQLMNCKAR